MRIEWAGSTHVGMRRPQNEDAFLLLPEENLCVVADGMGGHASGEIASRLAIEAIEAFFRRTSDMRDVTWPFGMDTSRPWPENRLRVGIHQANERIAEFAASDPRYRGMGTTVVSFVVAEGKAWIGWAGDSRAYRFRAGRLEQLSEDHSLVADLIRTRQLTPEQAEHFPHKNVVVKALGMREPVSIDVRTEAPLPGDVYLLCSDGLSGMVSDERIAQVLARNSDLDRAAQQLIDAANAAGGIDNVTVALARIGSADQG